MQSTQDRTTGVELAIAAGLTPGAKLRDTRVFNLTSTGVEFRGDMTVEQFTQGLQLLRMASTGVQVWLADFLVQGRRLFGDERLQEILEQLEFPEMEVNRAAGIASLAAGIRRDGLTSEHYWVLAKAELSPAQQERWATAAVDHKLSAVTLLRSIKEGKVVKAETTGGPSRKGGVATIQGFAAIFDTWFKRVEGRDPIESWPEERLRELWEDLKGPTRVGLQVARRLGVELATVSGK